MSLSAHPKHLWILEDEPGCQFVYEQILSLRYHVRFFANLASFVEAVDHGEHRTVDLLIADVRLPDQSFLSFLASEEWELLRRFPLLVVSSVDDLDVLRLCFEKGAIDYITKPFGKNELIVKLERIFAAAGVTSSPTGVSADPVSMTATREDRRSSPLTFKEMQILLALIESAGEAVSRDALISRVWGRIKVHPKALDVHLTHLRKKLSPLRVEIRFAFPNRFQLLCDRMESPSVSRLPE